MSDDEAVLTGQQTSWGRLGSLVWRPPRPHGEQPRQRVVGPLELFYDLVVVVLVAQAAQVRSTPLGRARLLKRGRWCCRDRDSCAARLRRDSRWAA
jgi:hypothetical protein